MSNRALTAARNIKAGGPSKKAVLNCLVIMPTGLSMADAGQADRRRDRIV